MGSEFGLAVVIRLNSSQVVHEDGEQRLRHAGALAVLLLAAR